MGPCDICSRLPLFNFVLQLSVSVLHTHRYHPPKFEPNLNHHDGDLIFAHIACACCCCYCCLLLPVLLAAAAAAAC